MQGDRYDVIIPNERDILSFAENFFLVFRRENVRVISIKIAIYSLALAGPTVVTTPHNLYEGLPEDFSGVTARVVHAQPNIGRNMGVRIIYSNHQPPRTF